MDTRPFLSDQTLFDVYPEPANPEAFEDESDEEAEHLRQLRLVADLAVQSYIDTQNYTKHFPQDAIETVYRRDAL